MSAAAASDAPPPLRRNRDFVLLWSGQLVSTVGSGITTLAFPLLVLAVTGSPARAGVAGFAASLANLVLYLPAGALVDRWDRKRVMLVADGVRAVALATIPLALALDALTFGHVVAVALLDGALGVFFRIAENVALPHVVPKEQLSAAIAQNQARDQGAGVVSQPLAGLLFSLGRPVPFLFDAVSYAVSFLSLLFVRPAFQRAREPEQRSLRTEIAEGVRWLWNQRFLRTAIALSAGTNFAHSALALVLIVRARELGASSTLIGVMFALFSAGAVVGSIVAPAVQRRVAPATLIVASIWLWCAMTAALVAVPNVLALGALAGVQALVGPPWNVVVGSYAYALVPDRLRGRVRGAGAMVSWGAIPLGSLAAGFALEAAGARWSFLALAVVFALVATFATASREIRNAPRLDSIASAA